jgi:hypothetical protein
MNQHQETVLANNILEFLIDPTKFPVTQRLYFRPEEILRNESYEDAKADSFKAYRDQKRNSDFYPSKNRQEQSREASIMDRKTVIASLDVLAQHFVDENDPIAKDLRTIAFCVSKMANEEFDSRLASSVEAKKEMEMIKCPTCEGKVMKQTGYCLHCKKKISDMKEASDDLWTKEAAEAVQMALVSDVIGGYDADDEEKPAEKVPEEKPAEPAPEKKEEVEAKKVVEPAKEEKESFMETPERGVGIRMQKPSLSPGGGKIETIYKDLSPKTKQLIDSNPELKVIFKKAEEEAPAPVPVVPAPEEKSEEAPVKKEKAPVPEEEVEAGKKKEEEKKATEPKKIVDTNILAFGDIEMEAGMQDVEELSADEQSRLGQLFQ